MIEPRAPGVFPEASTYRHFSGAVGLSHQELGPELPPRLSSSPDTIPQAPKQTLEPDPDAHEPGQDPLAPSLVPSRPPAVLGAVHNSAKSFILTPVS